MEEIYLPLDIIKNSPGFSIDIGCSVGKLIYRPKSLYKNGDIISQDKVLNNRLGPVYLRLFKRGDIEGLIDIIREECDLCLEPGLEVIVSGLGSSAAGQQLQAAFGISLKVESEFDLGADTISFIYENLGPERLFLPEPPGAREEAVRRFKVFQGWMKGGTEMSRVVWEMKQDEEESLAWQPVTSGDIYPYLLIVCGSLFAMTVVQKDGSIQSITSLFFSGRFIMGLLATLTGEKDFDKLITMAESSDGLTTDIYGEDLMKMDQKPEKEEETREGDDNEDIYQAMKGDLIVFPFGKPATSDAEVKKGDMVHSVLDTACMNLALVAQMTAAVHSCKHVFFAGGFVNPALIREWLTREMIRKNLESPVGKRLDFRFIRHGGHLSSVGAFLAGAKQQKRTLNS